MFFNIKKRLNTAKENCCNDQSDSKSENKNTCCAADEKTTPCCDKSKTKSENSTLTSCC